MRITLSLYCLLLICTASFAATGPEVAQLLNRRYQSTVAKCAGDQPAFFCSGVLLRDSAPSGEFWKHGTVSTQLGADSFTYVRSDLSIRRLTQKNGAVFADQFTAIGWGKALEVLCAYPFNIPAMGGQRPFFGCRAPNTLAMADEDLSNCESLGVDTAPAWVAHFEPQSAQPGKQCSLSSREARTFLISLQAHELMGAAWSSQPNQLMIRNWDADRPAQLPLQGLFYDVTQTSALLGAQKDQRDYFNATGDWLPILRMDLHQGPDKVFGFNQQDQLYIGYQVASKLNARYADTDVSCRGNTAAFYCNGVLIRATDVSTAFHSWNPSPQSVNGNGVSFTYVRADTRITKVYKPQGFIIRESAAPTGKPLTVRCLYPFDAGTAGSADICRTHGGLCSELGITTKEAWVARYRTTPTRSCAFDTDVDHFQLATTVRPDATDPLGWNELITAAWTEERPEQLPLEAITINTPVHQTGDGVAGARYIQRDYFQVTGRFVPIVRVRLNATTEPIFSYDPQDQTTQDSTMATLSNAIPDLPSDLRDD